MRPDDEKKTGESSSIDNGDQLSPKEPELVDGGYGVSVTANHVVSRFSHRGLLDHISGMFLECRVSTYANPVFRYLQENRRLILGAAVVSYILSSRRHDRLISCPRSVPSHGPGSRLTKVAYLLGS